MRQYLHDDPETTRLSDEVVAKAPVQLWPSVVRRQQILPEDVEAMLEQLL